MERRSLRRRESRFVASDGLSLFRRAWLPEDSDRAIVLVHGFGEHSGRYDHVGARFARDGYAVHAYDHRGHGRSGGPQLHLRRFDEYLDDLATFLEIVRDEHPGLPLVLLGHSMGGLVVSAYLAERDPDVEAAVLSGPALAPVPIGRGRKLWSGIVRAVLPRLRLAGTVDSEQLSRDPAVVRAYDEDPLVYRRPTISLMTELLAAIERVQGSGATLGLPVMVLHGEDDRIVSAEGSRAFALTLADSGSTLRLLPKLRHEILNEPEREALLDDILAWLESAAGKRGMGEPGP